MKLRSPVCFAALLVVLIGAIAWADQIVLKDGTVYSGKFMRGDSNSVEFRVLGRIENFKVSDIDRIVFKEPELDTTSATRTAMPTATASPTPRFEDKPVTASPVGDQVRQAPLPESRAAVASAPVQNPAQNTPAAGITLPVGTPVTIRTSTNIDTDRNRVGDVFDASLDQPVVWGDKTVFPRGTTVKGRIAYAKESGKLSGQAQLILELTELVYNGKSYFLRTSDYTEAGVNRGNRTAATVGGTAALGAIIGAIAGGGTGAAVGAASGAAVGTGVQVMTRGQVLKIPAETILDFRLQAPLTVDAP
jgi:hypothetical protein